MPRKVGKKELDRATRARVFKEMAKPRMAMSAMIAQRNLQSRQITQPPRTTMPGIVDKIIPPVPPRKPEKAQIAIAVARHQIRHIRIKNSLLDKNGNRVKLKKGAHVEFTASALPKR